MKIYQHFDGQTTQKEFSHTAAFMHYQYVLSAILSLYFTISSVCLPVQGKAVTWIPGNAFTASFIPSLADVCADACRERVVVSREAAR